MNKPLAFLGPAALAVFLAPVLHAGTDLSWGPAGDRTVRIGPVLGVMSRAIAWDDGDGSSRLGAAAAFIRAEFDLQWGVTVGIQAGLSLTDYEGMVFRNLPFSLEYAAGGAEGIVIGASLQKYFFSAGDFEIGARGEFVYNIGLKKTWPLEGLAVAGEAVGEPYWMAGWVGPTVVFKGYEKFVPRLTVAADFFSGEFLMQQTVGGLKGSETQTLSGAGFLRVQIGTDYHIHRKLTLTGEAFIIPCRDGTSAGAWAGLHFSF